MLQFPARVERERRKRNAGDATFQNEEKQRCRDDVAYFIDTYCMIYNATERNWLRFALWPAQKAVLFDLTHNLLTVILKARQLGLSWLVLCYALWLMRFHPAVAVLIFSKRDEEATELLERMKGIDSRLPLWLKEASVAVTSKHDYSLSNASSAKAFPTTGGRSYTGSLVIIDEADFVENLDALLNAVKPTIDAGGQMILISSADKTRPESPFKRIYRGAKRQITEWLHIFLPWHVRPGRSLQWYELQKADILARTGALDDLHQEYPATDTEALAPRSLDKRISPLWIERCYEEIEPIQVAGAPAIPHLEIFRAPVPGERYAIGADPAEGNPTSDDSALTVMSLATGEEIALLAGKFEPSTFAAHLAAVSRFYNDAPAMIERNNHGHAVIQWLEEHARHLRLLAGHDSEPGKKRRKIGWVSSKLGKTLLYTECAAHFRLSSQEAYKILHSFATYQQLSSIDGSTLRAPEGQHDDRADSFALAHVACIEMASFAPTGGLVMGSVKGWGL